MRNRIANLYLTATVLILGGCATVRHDDGFLPLRVDAKTPERITLKTFGSPGQSFVAMLTLDGSRQDISGITPAEYPLECVVLLADVTKLAGDGKFGFVIERQERHGLFYTPEVKEFCRFRYYAGSFAVATNR